MGVLDGGSEWLHQHLIDPSADLDGLSVPEQLQHFKLRKGGGEQQGHTFHLNSYNLGNLSLRKGVKSTPIYHHHHRRYSSSYYYSNPITTLGARIYRVLSL